MPTTLDFLVQWFGEATGFPVEPGPPYPVEIRNVWRSALPKFLAALGCRRGAEVGVWKGDFSVALCKANPELQLLCVDPWRVYEGYRGEAPRGGEQAFSQASVEEAFRVATEALEPYECVLDRRSSEDAVRDVPDGSLDFVYIDGNHSYLHCVQDLEWWSRKVRSGGIVAGHDFRHFPVEDNVHVIEAVTGFTAAHAITPWFLMGRYKVARSRLNKRGGERTERCRTYLWVNP